MDNWGEMILGTWLYGDGHSHDIVDDPWWTDYMKAHVGLKQQILNELGPLVTEFANRKKMGRFPIAHTFHAEFPENSDFSGYALLHGSNKEVGDFKLLGWADVGEANEPGLGAYDIELELRFVFNDIVDPNGNYSSDRIRSRLANFLLLGKPRSYRLSISWGSSCLAEVRPGQPIQFFGYPSHMEKGIRPLPQGKLRVK
jgi:hypothetical protein